MALPRFLQPYLASYDLVKLREESPAVVKEVVSQVLNAGDEKAVRWVFMNYSPAQIREAIASPQRGVWFEESLNYWAKILQIKGIKNYAEAILNLNPS